MALDIKKTAGPKLEAVISTTNTGHAVANSADIEHTAANSANTGHTQNPYWPSQKKVRANKKIIERKQTNNS